MLALKQPDQDPAAAAVIESMGWVADGIARSFREQDAVLALVYLARDGSGELLEAVAAAPWLQDDLTSDESLVLRGLLSIAQDNEPAAVRLLGMPFLEQAAYMDFVVLSSLQDLQEDDTLDMALSHPALRDGITEAQRSIVAALNPGVVRNPHAMGRLLDPERTVVAEKVVTLPLKGDVALSVTWTGGGASSSGKASSMVARLEDILFTFEAFLDAPYPHEHATVLVTNPGSGAGRIGDWGSYAVLSSGSGNNDWHLSRLIAGEYWSGFVLPWVGWVEQGAERFMASMYPALRDDRPVPLPNPCDEAANIHEMLSLPDTQFRNSGYVCESVLGEGMFLHLYSVLGDAAFRKAFEQLRTWWTDDALSVRCAARDASGLCHVRAAFVDGITPGLTDEDIRLARAVINLHYYGSVTPPTPTPAPSR